MWQSTTLPRPRPGEAPPPPPPHKATTLQRRPATRNVDVNKLRSDIDTLSQQLLSVKAQLESALAQKESENYVDHGSRRNSMDSRLSTVLLSPSPQNSHRNTPTPKPTRIIISNDHLESEYMPLTPVPAPRKPLSFSATHLTHLTSIVDGYNRRLEHGFPSSSAVFMPKIQRRETFTKSDEKQRASTLRTAKIKRAESLAADMGFFGTKTRPPPKPSRNFQEQKGPQLNLLRLSVSNVKNQSTYTNSSVALLSMCNPTEFAEAVSSRFRQGQCWFSRGGLLHFVNPFNNISTSRNHPYSVIKTVTSSLFESRQSVLLMRGLSGSGKSQLSEMVAIDVMEHLDREGTSSSILRAAIVVLRPMLSTNNSQNNQASRAIQHYEFQIRDGKLSRLLLRHFLLESTSRGCRANIFAMVANDLTESEQEKYRIAGFRLRENCSNYGNLEEVRSAFNTLGVCASDVFKVFCACILLNNLNFKEVKHSVDIENLHDLEDACFLLGVSALSMYRYIMVDASEQKNSFIDCQAIRDSLVSAIFTRTVEFIINKINILLDPSPEQSERGSVFTDSGISVSHSGAPDTHTIHVIDAPGYVKVTNNSLTELLINHVNDILHGSDRERVAKLLSEIEQKSKSENPYATFKRVSNGNHENVTLSHCDNRFEVTYDTRRFASRNVNTMPVEMASLFDIRSCTFGFAVKLFADDVEHILLDKRYQVKSMNWPNGSTTVIGNVLESVKKIQNDMLAATIHQIICIKSNALLEFAKLDEGGLNEQLHLYRSVFNRSSTKTDCDARVSMRQIDSKARPLPPPRRYEVRENQKHMFPQRRTILIDFQDPTSGVLLRAGEIVKALGFSGECYIVETGRKGRATVPISFTDRSYLPPTGQIIHELATCNN